MDIGIIDSRGLQFEYRDSTCHDANGGHRTELLISSLSVNICVKAAGRFTALQDIFNLEFPIRVCIGVTE